MPADALCHCSLTHLSVKRKKNANDTGSYCLTHVLTEASFHFWTYFSASEPLRNKPTDNVWKWLRQHDYRYDSMPVVMSMQSLEKEINGDGKRGMRENKWWKIQSAEGSERSWQETESRWMTCLKLKVGKDLKKKIIIVTITCNCNNLYCLRSKSATKAKGFNSVFVATWKKRFAAHYDNKVDPWKCKSNSWCLISILIFPQVEPIYFPPFNLHGSITEETYDKIWT